MMKSIKKRIFGFSNSEKGFTLIEIIAVLVILGILAAVALPKFANLQADARNKAASSALAEASARLSQTYALFLLSNNGNTGMFDAGDVATAAGLAPWGDFEVSLTNGATWVTIEVTTVQNVATTNSITKTWNMPAF